MSQFRLAQWTDARGFVDAAGEFLSTDEAVNAVVLGVSQTIANSDSPDQPGYFFGLVYQGNEPVAAAIRTPPRSAAVTQGPPEAMALLADALVDQFEDLPGANGPSAAVNALAHGISFQTGKRIRVDFEMRIHRLDAVQPLSLPNGTLRRAGPDDSELIHAWRVAFTQEAMGRDGPARETIVKPTTKADPGYYLWCVEGVPVSMAACARPTANGISVNAVYTPPSLRGHGYGSAVVHSLSSLLLGQGYSFCTLYTDLANPVSNAIYARIGYRPVLDTRNLEFVSHLDDDRPTPKQARTD